MVQPEACDSRGVGLVHGAPLLGLVDRVIVCAHAASSDGYRPSDGSAPSPSSCFLAHFFLAASTQIILCTTLCATLCATLCPYATLCPCLRLSLTLLYLPLLLASLSLHPVTRICLLCPPALSAFSSAPNATSPRPMPPPLVSLQLTGCDR